MDLNILWFVLIVVLFTGFFFLEGFDYGVGMLLPFIGKTDEERRITLRTILPVWDGNEVWMITAGGASFAAFPHLYATMFSTFYLALFLMLVALILRGVAFELRGHKDSAIWRRGWDKCIVFGSVVPAFLWGVAVTDLIAGLAIDANMTYTGGFFGLLSPYSIVGGLAFVFVFAFHGAAFLTMRLADRHLIMRVQDVAKKAGALAVVFFVLCMGLTYVYTDLYANPFVCECDQQGLDEGLRLQRPRCRPDGRRLLPRALPAPHGVEPFARVQPDDLQCILDALHAVDHDDRRRLPRPDHTLLSDLDVLHLPQARDGCRRQPPRLLSST